MPKHDDYNTEVSRESADEFALRHPHLFLLELRAPGAEGGGPLSVVAPDAPEEPTAAFSRDTVDAWADVLAGRAEPSRTGPSLLVPLAPSRARSAADGSATVTFFRKMGGLKLSSGHSAVTTLSVSRSISADVVLPFAPISCTHAHLLIAVDGGVTVVDQASRNGTYVNERRIEPGERVRLRPRATLRFGMTAFEVLSARELHEAVRGGVRIADATAGVARG